MMSLSVVCSRLDLRKATIFHADGAHADLKKLSDDTADFFCNAVGTTFGPLANVSVETRAAPAGVMGGEGEL